jgi:quercetin 2,3-dioxygenase
LAAANKQSKPQAFHVAANQMPQVCLPATVGAASLRVVAGQYMHVASPICANPEWLTRTNMFDISATKNSHFSVEVPDNHNVIFVLREGSLVHDGVTLLATNDQAYAVLFSSNEKILHLQSGAQELRGVLLTGVPLGEPVVSHGPFTGNTTQDITNYLRRFQAGEMGQIANSH